MRPPDEAAPSVITTPDAAEKTFATLQATAALRGIQVRRVAGDCGTEYLVSLDKSGGTYVARRFSMDALVGLLGRMGVRLP